MRHTIKKTIKWTLFYPVKLVLDLASRCGFVKYIIRQQQWHAEECEQQRRELKVVFQWEKESFHRELETVTRQKIEACLCDLFSLSSFENAIYNKGERLIPERSHDDSETIRHKSSYRFFRKIIEQDMMRRDTSLPLSILDIGCGCGHGTFELSGISGVKVTGIDVAPNCIDYASVHYGAENIDYEVIDDIFEYVKTMKLYDYIVSRHVFEHIPDAFSLIEKLRWTKRLLINVPFEEKPGNPFHLLLNITENSFPDVKTREFFYEDLAGKTYLSKPEGVFINSICCCYSNDLPAIAADSCIGFPLQSWKPEGEHAVMREKYKKLVDTLNSGLQSLNYANLI